MGFFDFQRVLRKPTSKATAQDERKTSPLHETLAEHMKHCQAMKNGKVCPFVKKLMDVDVVDRDRNMSSEDPDVLEAVEEGEKKAITVPEGDSPISPVAYEKLAAAMTDLWKYEGTLDQTRIDEAIVRKAINAGLAAMHKILENEKCVTGTDKDNTRIVILPPHAD